MLNRNDTTITQKISKNSTCIVFDICLYSLRILHLLQIEIKIMAKIKGVSVRLKNALKDGTENIVIQINAGEKRRAIIKTGVSVRPDRFVPDDNWFLLKKPQKGELLNEEITSVVTEVYTKITDLISGYEKAGFSNWTIAKLKKDLNNKPQSAKFCEMIEAYIKKPGKKYSTKEGYKNDLKFIKKYCGSTYESLECSDIDFDWVYSFRQYCIINNENGTIKCDISTIRKREMLIGATLNLAVSEGFLLSEMVPYGEKSGKLKKIDRKYRDQAFYRLISTAKMKQFVDYKCDHSLNRNIPWKILMFQCLTKGKISFRSLAILKKSDIVLRKDEDGVYVKMLHYLEKTHKTDQYVILTPEMNEIIQYFADNYPPYKEYLFPIINREFDSIDEMDLWLMKEKKSCHDLNFKNRQPMHFRGKYDTKRKFDLDYIKSIMHKEFWEKDTLLAKNLFLFSYYAQGLNLVDMFKLKYSHIVELEKQDETFEKVIKIARTKTGAILKIPINKNLQRIIEFFENNEDLFPRIDGYILPILNDEKLFKDEVKALEERHRFNRNFNLGLKKIAKNLKWPETISKSFSSYYARHSFATHLVSVGASSVALKEALGHKDLATTDTYVHQLENQYMKKSIIDALVS